MLLLFKNHMGETLIPKERGPAELDRLTGRSAMVIEAMKAGIPLEADGGEYILVENDYCTNCGGTGRVSKDAPVYRGEHPSAAVAEGLCECADDGLPSW